LSYVLWKKPTTKPKYKGKGAFLGSGTTIKLAKQNDRNSIGYETDETLLPLIKKENSLPVNSK
jgi:hypothetical protein